MKTAGIVVEYNPLHNGHLYHLDQVRKITGCDLIIAVMSGNFVQRGEFAVTDKWRRAEAAVKAGVNLVIELPFPFVVQSATQFGSNAIRLLHMAKADSVVFGSETNNLEELQEIASLSFNIDNFRENMKKGYSYPASYGYMADSYGPNDILAISYLRALQQYPDMIPYSILRTSDYHDDDLSVEYPSAKAIREGLLRGEDISTATPMSDLDDEFPTWEKMYPFVRTILLTRTPEELARSFLMDEGIENHLIKQANTYDSYGEFINAAVTKRYTRSRIQRTLCHLLVNNTKENMSSLPELDRIRPLWFDEAGQKYIKQLQQDGVIVVNHFTQNIKQYRELEYRAAAVYGMTLGEKKRRLIMREEVCGQYLKNEG